jgi:hypothetical protein
MRVALTCLLTLALLRVSAQNIESFGVFAGLNFPFTIDQGLARDPRFYGKFTLRGSPYGITYGYDKLGYGFVITPAYTQIGQKFTIVNTNGGDVGTRDVQMNYLAIPIALKLHLQDIAFFRLSAVAGFSVNYLLSGKETFTHLAAKLKYPPSVAVPNDPNYVQSYDGVFVPNVTNQVYVTKDKFNPLQLVASVGLRSDFDISDDWSINFDGRANFGIFDPRKSAYTAQLKQSTNAPDLYGQRRDLYLTVQIGIARIIQTKAKFKSRRSTGQSPRIPGLPKPRNKKPKG